MAREGARITNTDQEVNEALYEKLAEAPSYMDADELLKNLGLFMHRQIWADYIHMIELYKKIVNVHGVIAEFGVLWGKNLALFTALRGIYEPFNLSRKIIGFDTFEGFSKVSHEDGSDVGIKKGYFDTVKGYEKTLSEILHQHEKKCPISHVTKHELIKGDVSETLQVYHEEHPETIYAMIYIDIDLFEPTREILRQCMPKMSRGGIVGFDEVGHSRFPGETTALLRDINCCDFKLERLPFSGYKSFWQVT